MWCLPTYLSSKECKRSDLVVGICYIESMEVPIKTKKIFQQILKLVDTLKIKHQFWEELEKVRNNDFKEDTTKSHMTEGN